MKFGLRETDLQFMQALFAQEPAIDEVWLFGSRAKNEFQPGSDVDIALLGANLTRQTVSRIHAILEDESPIPYFFDVVHLNKLRDENVKNEIWRVAQLLYQRPS